jgi:hypothetical protein
VSESDFGNRMKGMCSEMRGLSVSRMNEAAKTSLLTKTRWALIGRNKFDQLVSGISNLINELIAAFPGEAVAKKRDELCQQDARALQEVDPKALDLLKNAMGE